MLFGSECELKLFLLPVCPKGKGGWLSGRTIMGFFELDIYDAFRCIHLYIRMFILKRFSHNLFKLLEHCIARESADFFTPISSGTSCNVDFRSSAYSPCVFTFIVRFLLFILYRVQPNTFYVLMDFRNFTHNCQECHLPCCFSACVFNI